MNWHIVGLQDNYAWLLLEQSGKVAVVDPLGSRACYRRTGEQVLGFRPPPALLF